MAFEGGASAEGGREIEYVRVVGGWERKAESVEGCRDEVSQWWMIT